MPPKKATRTHGLERTDNEMPLTSWPQVGMVNQKNYYTEYLKRDDQLLALRPNKIEEDRKFYTMVKQARDKDREQVPANLRPDGAEDAMDVDGDADEEDLNENAKPFASRTVVIHPGSQNLRIGLASNILPKSIPMVIARRSEESESEAGEGEPQPKRRKLESDADKLFDDEFVAQYASMTANVRDRSKRAMVRSVPNAREQAIIYNRRTSYEEISEHNDSVQIDWTEIPPDHAAASNYITGNEAMRIPDQSHPRYKLSWPIRHGKLNEADYDSKNQLIQDLTLILEDAIIKQLGVPRRDWHDCSCVFVVPDLYERNYVTTILDMLFRDFGFIRVTFIQESLAASFGAGYSTCVVVDVGAQKTSVCCVEEGVCVESSRVALRYGGADVTETFVKMMLLDGLPYADINLKRRYDFILAEELKRKFCTLNIQTLSNVSKPHEFDLRAPGQRTRHYFFKTFDQVMLAPLGYIEPAIFDNSKKLVGHRKLLSRSHDLYDGAPNDPVSSAQDRVLFALDEPENEVGPDAAGDSKLHNGIVRNGTPAQKQGPAPKRPTHDGDTEDQNTPREGSPNEGEGDGEKGAESGKVNPIEQQIKKAEQRDARLPVTSLVDAINISIAEAAREDERKIRDFYGGIMTVGGGSLTSNFHQFLERELLASQPRLKKELLVNLPPREMDPQVLCWKGASVFGKLSTNDAWVSRLEHSLLNSRILTYKCIFNW